MGLSPCRPTYTPPVTGSSLFLQADCSKQINIHPHLHFLGNPSSFSGLCVPVFQAGRNYTALTLQAFPLPFLGVCSLLLSVWENAAINSPPHL